MTEFANAELTLCGLQYVKIQLLSDFSQRGQSVFRVMITSVQRFLSVLVTSTVFEGHDNAEWAKN